MPLCKCVVIEEFASPRCRIFLAKTDDLHLKSAQNGRFSQPLTSGSNIAWGRPKNPPKGSSSGRDFLDSRLQGRGVRLIILSPNGPTRPSPRLSLGTHLVTSDGKSVFPGVLWRIRAILGKEEKSESRKRKPLRIKGRNENRWYNFGKVFADVTYY